MYGNKCICALFSFHLIFFSSSFRLSTSLHLSSERDRSKNRLSYWINMYPYHSLNLLEFIDINLPVSTSVQIHSKLVFTVNVSTKNCKKRSASIKNAEEVLNDLSLNSNKRNVQEKNLFPIDRFLFISFKSLDWCEVYKTVWFSIFNRFHT